MADIPVAEKYGVLPGPYYWVSCAFGEYDGHAGMDIGGHTGWDANCGIYAWKSGRVAQVGYNDNDLTTGYFITLEHHNEDGTWQYTNYLHMKEAATLKVGDIVKRGQKIGIRGGTPCYNVHLHFTTSQITKDRITSGQRQWAAKYCVDPLNFDVAGVWIGYENDYDIMYTVDPWDDKTPGGWYRDFRWCIPHPVDEDKTVDQYEVTIDDLYIRMQPTKEGRAYQRFCVPGFYNVKSSVEADGYVWYEIAHNYYISGAKNGVDTHGVYHAKSDISDLKKQLEEAKAENLVLSNKIEKAKADLA